MTEAYGESEIRVHKLVSYVEMPEELAMEYGLIPDTRPPYVPPRRSLVYRVRSILAGGRERIRLAGQVLAGKDIHEDCER